MVRTEHFYDRTPHSVVKTEHIDDSEAHVDVNTEHIYHNEECVHDNTGHIHLNKKRVGFPGTPIPHNHKPQSTSSIITKSRADLRI